MELAINCKLQNEMPPNLVAEQGYHWEISKSVSVLLRPSRKTYIVCRILHISAWTNFEWNSFEPGTHHFINFLSKVVLAMAYQNIFFRF